MIPFHKRTLLRLAAAALLTLASHGFAALPGVLPDDDRDGIVDALEQRLAERFAPMIYIEPDESNYPVNVPWLLARTRLNYQEDCTGDVDQPIGPVPIGNQLLGPGGVTVWTAQPNCGQDDTGYSHPPHRQISTLATDPDGQFSLGAQTTGYSDQQTFYLTDLPDSQHIGSTNPRDWVTYFHAYPTKDGGIMLQYWHVFAYNAFGGVDNHGGDWDASIQVQLDRNLEIEGVWFSRHSDDHPGTFFKKSDNLVRFFQGTHPVVAIDGGGHAAFRSPDDWATCGCRFGETATGPIGTISWSNDAAFDDPATLGKVHWIGGLTFLSGAGGIVWKTWTDGGVRSSGRLTNPIVSPSAHGGLVNVGEYNPCTPDTCHGSAQASKLLAGEFHLLNNAFWLRYEGRWGSVGAGISGPRGPVFQGFTEQFQSIPGSPFKVPVTSVYEAWYNQGADAPATNDGVSTWKLPARTIVTGDSPAFPTGNATFITSNSLISIGSFQSTVAAQYGTATTYYRIFRSGVITTNWAQYQGAFRLQFTGLSLPDGQYNVEYYSVDGLGNAEPVQSAVLILDNAAPSVTITSPAPRQYLHSMSLPQLYNVADGTGAGIASTSVTLDGVPVGTGRQTLNLLALALGTHELKVTSTDKVGWSNSDSVRFVITVSADSIKADVTQFEASGDIKSQKLATTLMSLLNAAATAKAAGQCSAASTAYQSFIQHLQGQVPAGVSAGAARIMIADAQALIAQCP